MADTLNLLKRIALKKVDQLKESASKGWTERIDKNLPMGVRIGGMVEIPQVDFVLGGDALKVKYPGTSSIVLSYGTFPVGGSLVHRFYLDGEDKVYLWQLVTDPKQTFEESKLFMPYDEVYPEDWDFWLSSTDGYIGLSAFQLKDGTQYVRVWEDEEAETVLQEDASQNRLTRIPPVQFMEKIFLDPYGETTEMVKHDSMLYGRQVNENVAEYLLVSAVNEKAGASVQIMVGIELEPSTVKVI
ncbi:MAG: DUF2491 family protein [Desulfomonile tiedjei]|nr:DUF2491 family protein [Desulfomonile tiedjei]